MIGYYNKATRLTLAAAHDRKKAADGRIFGTWDFKWPQQTVIKVAFRELPHAAAHAISDLSLPTGLGLTDAEKDTLESHQGFARLTHIVECLAQRWLANSPNIKFEFVHKPLASLAPEAKSSKGKSEAQSGGRGRPGSEGVAPEDLYDVLVSLEPLDAVLSIPQKGNAPPVTRTVFLPGSELGRYARRLDFNVPTVFLGPRKHYEEGKTNRLQSYFSSQEFYHWVIHEFGHVLGLPHEHQSPNARQRFELKDEATLLSTLRQALGYSPEGTDDITDAEITEEILTAWPVTFDSRGRILYSDFRSYRQGDAVGDDDSVMFHVFWKRLVEGGPADAPPTYHVRPTPRDLVHLGKMYPAT
jgi:hypothetical protein